MNSPNNKIKGSAPGRICLFGEHQDYLGLPVIAAAISLRISIEGSKRNDDLVNLNLPDIKNTESFGLKGNIHYHKERDYFKSCVNVLKKYGYTFTNGADCSVTGNIPINSGASSSSALIVAWINFLTQISDQKNRLSSEEIARLAYQAEVLEFSEPGGMMDHYSTAMGGIIYLESFPEINISCIDLDPGYFVLGNSGEAKDTKDILARVKNQIIEIVKNIKRKHPEFSLQNIEYEQIEKYQAELNDEQLLLLKGTVQNRNITQEAKKVLSSGNPDKSKLGTLLNEHQNV